jgi:hypothetical protein
MAMNAHLPGRLSNSSLSPSHGLYPVFESVVNSIHAIDDNGGTGDITITINRATDQPDVAGAGAISYARIEGFTVVDTGVGFNSKNFASFETMDSRAKALLGGKGVGRLLWLLAFERARITSVFDEGGKRWKRSFEFEPTVEGIVKHSLVEVEDEKRATTLELLKLFPQYADRIPKQAPVIARRIIDHCLAYFVLGTCPPIRLIDSQTAEQMDLLQLFQSEVMGGATSEAFSTKGQSFTVTHVKVAAGSNLHHKVHFCAHQRTVKSEQLMGVIPNLTPALKDEGEERPFVYCGYVSGDFLDATVNQDRTNFTIADEDVFGEGTEPIWPDVLDGSVAQASSFLSPYTAPIGEKKNEVVRAYVETKAPKYRHVLKHRPQVLDKIPATASEERMDLELYKAQQAYQHELQVRYQVLLKENDPKALALDQYEKAFVAFIEEWNEAGMAALAEHVMLRSATLRFLDSRRAIQESGKHLLEEAIHQVVFPLKTTSDDLPAEKMNLWIVDERLAYHHYLASDIPLSSIEVLENDSDDRPDIAIFNLRAAFVNSMSQYQSVVLVEFKKPGRNDYDEETNPFTQVYKYVRKIRDGRAKDRRGNYIHISENTPFYAHVVCELTPTFRQQVENYDFTPTPDGGGYFFFNSQLRVWIEVLSFDKMIDDAKRRNATFFDKLGVRPIG